MKPIVLKEDSMSIPEVKAQLEKIKERDKELTYRGVKTEEYLAQFTSISESKAKEMKEKIEALKVPRLREGQVKKLIDLMPTVANDVKVVLQGYGLTIKAEMLEKIAVICREFAPKK